MLADFGKRPPVKAGIVVIGVVVAIFGGLLAVDHMDQVVFGPKTDQSLTAYLASKPGRIVCRGFEHNGEFYYKLTRYGFTESSIGVWIYDVKGKLVDRELAPKEEPLFLEHWGNPEEGDVIPPETLRQRLEQSDSSFKK